MVPFLFLLLFAGPGGVTLTDDLGRTVTLASPPQRIISLAPSITESLFAIGAGKQLAGVTDYCNYPPEAASLPRVGGIINPSLEAIVTLRPDLVILSVEGNLRDDLRRLEDLGIPVFVTNPRSLDDIRASIRKLGTLTGRDSAAGALTAALLSRERSITARMPVRVEHRALLAVSLQPLIAAGGGTFLADLIERAGASNIAAGAGGTYPQFSREAVIAMDPDAVLVLSDAASSAGDVLKMIPEWRSLRAVRSGTLHILDADLFARPGPRAADALVTLHRALFGR
jgi:iron complex transport system substrate-binding protein